MSIAERTGEAVREYPFLYEALRAGVVNYAPAAEATVSTIREDGFATHAGEIGEYLRDRLEQELGDGVQNVRGKGLMVSIELDGSAADVVAEMAHEEQVLALTAGTHVVRFLPPLVIEEDHADRAVAALGNALW